MPRLTAVRWTALAGVLTWGVCVLLGAVLGPAAGRPPADALAGVNAGYPVTQLAVAVAVAATALPYLSRPLHRLVSFLVTLAVLAAVCGGYALPVNAISSVALGWGVAAALHLAVGSPLGLPSAAEITDWITDLSVSVRDLTRSPRQVWGVEQFTGRDPAGNAIELSVYGRDASDARMLAKLWRFCLYRDSGPTLILDRLQQVEHEAYLTLMAGRAGVLVPDVLAAGRFGPSRDAALVTRLPDGVVLSEAAGADLADGTLDEMLRAVLRLRDAGLAHGALGGDTIIVSGRGICVRDFRCASASAPASRLDGDLAAALGAMAVRAGAERTAAAAARVLDAGTARGALVHLQRSALDPVTVAALKQQKDLLPRLRAAVAAGAGIEVPKLAEAKRISWANLLFAVGSLIGVWLIIGVLADAGDSLAAIKGASWGWVALAFVLAQLPMVAEGWALLGAAVGDLPFGRCVALETSNTFTALVGGDVAVFALRVRFFQRQGYDAEAAVSAGAIATTASWTAKSLLFLIAIPFAAGTFHAPSSSGGRQDSGLDHPRGDLGRGDRRRADRPGAAAAAAGQQQDPPASGEHLGQRQDDRHRATQARLRAGRLDSGAAPGRPGPRRLAARGRAARQHRDPDHRQHAGRHRRRRRARARRPRRRGGRPDRRAHQRGRPPGPGRRGGAHPAAVHGLPAPGLGLRDPGLDAPPGIRMITQA